MTKELQPMQVSKQSKVNRETDDGVENLRNGMLSRYDYYYCYYYNNNY